MESGESILAFIRSRHSCVPMGNWPCHALSCGATFFFDSQKGPGTIGIKNKQPAANKIRPIKTANERLQIRVDEIFFIFLIARLRADFKTRDESSSESVR